MARILIIDDDNGLLQTLRIGLEARGYEVTTAESGNSGFHLALRYLPDIVLSDVNMRDGDGYSALSAFRADPKTAAIPVIIMTGQATESGMRQGMEMGADDYLPKPFSIKAAVAAIQARLKKQETLTKKAEASIAALKRNLSLMLPHELRTPLTTILGVGSLFSTSAAALSNEEVANFGGMIIESGERLRRLTENFWFFARLEMLADDPTTLRVPRPHEEIDVRRVVGQAATIKAESHHRSDDLTLRVTDARCRISGEFLGKITEELVDNGLKFSEPGERVEVETDRTGSAFTLRVKDAGRGMETEEAARVGAFMQFQRDTYEQQGVGLGLAIVRRLVDLHGGQFDIASAPESGTTVTVTIPG